MKLFAIVLLVNALVSGMTGAMILSATGRPPEFANWWWRIGRAEIHANGHAVWIYALNGVGAVYTPYTFVFWPPRVYFEAT